jgi:hypothetical protein
MDMERDASAPDAICAEFNRLHWHDSKLIAVSVVRSEDRQSDEVHIELDLIVVPTAGEQQWRRTRLVLQDCTIIKIELDLSTKRVCSDDISDARCYRSSVLKNEYEKSILSAEIEPLAQYLHFAISLIPPAGEINAFARSFLLTEPGQR